MRKSDIEETCNTRLELGLGVGENYYGATTAEVHASDKKQPLICFDPTAVMAQQDLDNTKSLNDDKNNNKGCSKKLKLTKDQATVLENSFNSNNILNPAHKQALAEQLNLKQRQIEVWFQNRRARTKLKQTEDEHEMLRRQCEILSNENRKLRDELRNLRSLIKFEPFDHGLVHLPFPNPTNQISVQIND